jgi:hypothetical protein
LCLSQAWISHIICHGFFFVFSEWRWEVIVQWVKVRGDCSVSEGERWLFSEWRWEVIVQWVKVKGDCSVSEGERWLFILLILLELLTITV